MTYILKGSSEGSRLDEQTEIEEYSLKKELEDFHPKAGTKVLDAGCGSGVLCRYLESMSLGLQVSGCDLSEASLKYAQEKKLGQQSQFFKHDIVNQNLPDKYNTIFNRLVAHHLSIDDYQKVLNNFFSALVPQGEVCIIDPDGLFLNLGTQSKTLLNKMDKIKNNFGGNLTIGRYIPGLLKNAGFSQIKWKIEVMDFNQTSRIYEARQWKERFENSLQFYVDLFGTEFEARLFFKEYVSEVLRPEVPLFYNKFIVSARKN